MRTKRTSQVSIRSVAQHDLGRELAAMSAWLDAHPDVLNEVAKDLKLSFVKATGRSGMTAKSVLRCTSHARSYVFQKINERPIDPKEFSPDNA